ncbi:hypothetical protein E4T39_06798 [Aureobasidium subglaciale]|nr:hypothetical protein E4T39_06798 [Aureobasidium subglaciale]
MIVDTLACFSICGIQELLTEIASSNTFTYTFSHFSELDMADPYPNESANTIYNHLRSFSNTIGDLGDTVASLQLSTTLLELHHTNMPSFGSPGSIRRRFLRIVSFGRISSRSAEDTEPLLKAHDHSRRHSAPPNVDLMSCNGYHISPDRNASTTFQHSSQSSDSAQTTIIHERSANAIPFSIDAFRDQHRDYYFSTMDFATTAVPKVRQDMVTPARLIAEDPHSDSVQLRENTKSFLRCGNCGHFWDYKQIHCPGCAARTLRHVPGVSEASDGSSHDHANDAEQTGSPDWGTLEEESWATTTTNAIVASAAASSEAPQGSGSEPTVDPSSKKDTSGIAHKPHHSTIYCCYGRPGVLCVSHCCCDNPDAHHSKHHNRPKLCTQPCILRARPITAALIFDGPAPSGPMCRCWSWGSRHVCRRLWGGQYIEILEDEVPSDYEIKVEGHRGAYVGRKPASCSRLLKWFCCC